MKRLRLNFRINAEVVERAKNAIAALPAGLNLTLTSLAESGLTLVVKDLERQHNSGKPFPQRSNSDEDDDGKER